MKLLGFFSLKSGIKACSCLLYNHDRLVHQLGQKLGKAKDIMTMYPRSY